MLNQLKVSRFHLFAKQPQAWVRYLGVHICCKNVFIVSTCTCSNAGNLGDFMAEMCQQFNQYMVPIYKKTNIFLWIEWLRGHKNRERFCHLYFKEEKTAPKVASDNCICDTVDVLHRDSGSSDRRPQAARQMRLNLFNWPQRKRPFIKPEWDSYEVSVQPAATAHWGEESPLEPCVLCLFTVLLLGILWHRQPFERPSL